MSTPGAIKLCSVVAFISICCFIVTIKGDSTVKYQVIELHSHVNEDCLKPIEKGLCLAFIPRYAYNEESDECELFRYGGCGGNSNNFRTREDCENNCFKQSDHSASAI